MYDQDIEEQLEFLDRAPLTKRQRLVLGLERGQYSPDALIESYHGLRGDPLFQGLFEGDESLDEREYLSEDELHLVFDSMEEAVAMLEASRIIGLNEAEAKIDMSRRQGVAVRIMAHVRYQKPEAMEALYYVINNAGSFSTAEAREDMLAYSSPQFAEVFEKKKKKKGCKPVPFNGYHKADGTFGSKAQATSFSPADKETKDKKGGGKSGKKVCKQDADPMCGRVARRKGRDIPCKMKPSKARKAARKAKRMYNKAKGATKKAAGKAKKAVGKARKAVKDTAKNLKKGWNDESVDGMTVADLMME